MKVKTLKSDCADVVDVTRDTFFSVNTCVFFSFSVQSGSSATWFCLFTLNKIHGSKGENDPIYE